MVKSEDIIYYPKYKVVIKWWNYTHHTYWSNVLLADGIYEWPVVPMKFGNKILTAARRSKLMI